MTVINQLKKTEVLNMVRNVMEFFRNLPPKKCSECGENIEEQHECYGIVCDKCLRHVSE